MRIDAISIFPEFFEVLDLSLIGKAQEKDLVQFNAHNLRSWASGKHLSVDDTPFGGGAGMVMKADVWGKALDEILGFNVENGNLNSNDITKKDDSFSGMQSGKPINTDKKVLLIPSPSGKQFSQKFAEELSEKDQIVFACGRYEGIDSRVYEHYKSLENENFSVQEFSIGDYVLNGGEVASIVVIEAVTRLIPGMMGNPMSLVEESHCDDGFLEYPVYTRPSVWKGLEVPKVLLEGNHSKIERFRRNKSIEKTIKNRLDILSSIDKNIFDIQDKEIMAQNNIISVNDDLYSLKCVKADGHDLDKIVNFFEESRLKGIRNCIENDSDDYQLCNLTSLESVLQDNQNKCFVIKIDGKISANKIEYFSSDEEKIIGVLIAKNYDEAGTQKNSWPVKFAKEIFEDSSIFVNFLILSEEYENSGLEKLFLETIVEKEKVSKIHVVLSMKNKELSKKYKKIGFQKIGTRIIKDNRVILYVCDFSK